MDQAQCLFLSCEPDLGTTSWKNIWSWLVKEPTKMFFPSCSLFYLCEKEEQEEEKMIENLAACKEKCLRRRTPERGTYFSFGGWFSNLFS